jgi:type IV secretory pathway VirB6-like protein
MTMPSYTTVVVDLLNQTDAMTSEFLVDNYQAMASYMAAPLGVACTLYIVLTGYLVLTGYSNIGMKEFSKIAFTIGFVYTFALNWLMYSDYFVALFQTAASEISSIGVNKGLFKIPLLSSTGATINDTLQTVLIESVDVGVQAMKQGSYRNWMPLLVGLNFIGGGTFIVALATIEVAMLKFFSSLLLSTGPLFIGLALFEQTKGAFKAWLSLLTGFAFALIFAGLAVGMSMKWMHWVVGSVSPEEALTLKWHTIVPLVFVEILALVVLVGVVPLAKSIGGAVGGSHVGDAVGAVAKIGKTAIGSVKSANKGYKAYKDYKSKRKG